MGPKYRGAVVSREALEDSEDGSEDQSDEDLGEEEDESGSEDFDDPETADLEADQVVDDFEIDSDEAFGEGDEEEFQSFKFKKSGKAPQVNGEGKEKQTGKRPVAADFYTDSEVSEGEEDLGSEELEEDGFENLESDDEDGSDEDGAALSEEDEDDEEGEEEGDSDEDEEEDDDDESSDAEDGDDDQRAELRKIMGDGEKKTASNVAQAVKADAEKGVAVRSQRRAFDSILNLRIRLQKALVAVNSFSTLEADQDADKEPYQAAEEAAIKLWDTLDKFRVSLGPDAKARTGEKRKREFGLEATSQDIWESMAAAEELSMPHRRKVMDKWSSRVRNSTLSATTRKLKSAPSQNLLSVLDEHLLNPERLVKRARTPRSCAPAQASKKVDEDPAIYDDADFYQLLLKELVEQRSTDTTAPGASVTTVKWAAIKENKTRKQVDRRASKGRKLRFDVHEKIQNFMAPEDRRTWEEEAIDRFVRTLFGQKMELNEDDASDAEMGGAEVEEGFKLFQSK